MGSPWRDKNVLQRQLYSGRQSFRKAGIFHIAEKRPLGSNIFVTETSKTSENKEKIQGSFSLCKNTSNLRLVHTGRPIRFIALVYVLKRSEFIILSVLVNCKRPQKRKVAVSKISFFFHFVWHFVVTAKFWTVGSIIFLDMF